MNRKDVENIITEYVKPVYGFALKRCKSQEDAEDLAQEIEEEHIERLSPFAFSKCKIPVGAIITFIHQGNSNSVSTDMLFETELLYTS